MAGKFCVSLTCAKDNTDKATVAFVVANAAVASDKETMVFLSTEGVRLSQKGYADDIREEGFSPLRELMENFAKAGCWRFAAESSASKRISRPGADWSATRWSECSPAKGPTPIITSASSRPTRHSR